MIFLFGVFGLFGLLCAFCVLLDSLASLQHTHGTTCNGRIGKPQAPRPLGAKREAPADASPPEAEDGKALIRPGVGILLRAAERWTGWSAIRRLGNSGAP